MIVRALNVVIWSIALFVLGFRFHQTPTVSGQLWVGFFVTVCVVVLVGLSVQGRSSKVTFNG